jgi:hypothetical protein
MLTTEEKLRRFYVELEEWLQQTQKELERRERHFGNSKDVEFNRILGETRGEKDTLEGILKTLKINFKDELREMLRGTER